MVRPRKDPKAARSIVWAARFTPQEDRQLKAAMKRRSLDSKGDYVREVLLRSARATRGGE